MKPPSVHQFLLVVLLSLGILCHPTSASAVPESLKQQFRESLNQTVDDVLDAADALGAALKRALLHHMDEIIREVNNDPLVLQAQDHIEDDIVTLSQELKEMRDAVKEA
ncbi:hypothetical protein M8J77_022369 [Diaphorina citri]|nr:hypothetical protein M8J77_022369 [Diaphorina citri]KAI5708425.1 hypothetical protein M8J77_022369 [Diaphorina citri]